MDDKLVTIAEFGDSLDAQVAKSALESGGIKAMIVGQNIHELLPTHGMLNVEVKVFEKDLPRAAKIIEAMQNTTDDQQETDE